MGIPVKVHLTFILLLALIYFVGPSIIGIGGIKGVIFVILVFASVVFHELSHSFVARYYGVEVEDITLLPIGGVARMASSPDTPLREVTIAAAGPIASFVLAFSLWFAADVFGSGVTVSDMSVQGGLLAQLAAVNLVLAVFNLIPAFPMDGGRILRGLLGLYLRPLTATRIAVGVGQVLAIGLFFLGLLSMNPFMILIALFVYLGAETEERHVGIMISLGGIQAHAVMIRNVETVSPHQTIGDAAELYVNSFQGDFPVMDDSRLVGIVTREVLTETLHKQGPTTPLSQVMLRDFPTVTEETSVIEVLNRIESSGCKAVPVLSGVELKGLITLEHIGRYNMLCSGYSCEFMQSSNA